MNTTRFIVDDSWDDVLETAARNAAAIADAAGAAIVVVDGELDHFVAHVGVDPGLEISRAVACTRGYVQLVMRSGAVVVVADSTLEQSVRAEVFELLGIRSFSGVPLVIDGVVVGALGLFDRLPRAIDTSALLPLVATIEARLRARALENDAADGDDDTEAVRVAVSRRPALRLLQAVQAGAVPVEVFLKTLRLLPPITVR